MSRGVQWLLALAIVFFGATPKLGFGQAAWEYTPYRSRVWIAMERVPQVPASLVPFIADELPARARAAWGEVMQIQVSAAPATMRSTLALRLDEITPDAVATAASREDLEADKLYLAALIFRDGMLVGRVRELDCRSRQLGPIVERACPLVAALPSVIWDAIADCFTPLARIEQVEEQKMIARLRAGGLVTDPSSPVLAEPGDVLRPIVRRNDRSGQPAKGGIQAIPWTFMTVEERRDSLLECKLRSGYRAAVPARGGARIERLALVVRPRYDSTRLILRSRSDPGKPLIGYEIHRKMEGEEETRLLGMTDERGSFVLPRGKGSLETLVVKSGKQLLARLPVVAGCEETLTANVIDDDGRLAAEGFVAALSGRALDLVARREILAARIRARVKEGKKDEAQRMLDEFRRLETRADLSRDLDRYRRQVSTSDRVTQARIDKVFADAQKLLLLKPLTDDLLAQLTREVTSAKPTGGE